VELDKAPTAAIYQQAGVTPELIQEGRQNLLAHFRQKGFFDVQVDSDLQTDQDKETVLYRITQGKRSKIGGADFSGNQHIDEAELLQHVALRKPDCFRTGVMTKTA